MRAVARILSLGAVLVSGACLAMPPVQLEVTPADYDKLVGEWRGEYASAALGRRGQIEFKLVAGEYKASGDVVMTPVGSDRPYAPSTLQHQGDGRIPGDPQMLTISFVRAMGGTIRGQLDRYWDPDRNCDAYTVFQGRFADETIEGTFSTTWACGAGEATGTWKVRRR